MAKLSLHKVNHTDSRSGKWFTFSGPIRFKLGRAGSSHYREFIALNAEKYKGDFTALLNLAIASVIIFDWEAIDDESVEPCVVLPEGENDELWYKNEDDLYQKMIPYSVENAVALLENPEYEILHQWIDITANSNGNFRPDAVEKESSISVG